MSEENKKTNSNIADVLVAIINGFFNLFTIPKLVVILVLYLLYRDNKITNMLDKNPDLQKYLIDTKIINKIFETDNTTIIAMGAVIAVLAIVILFIVVFVIPMYKKEIDRISEQRSLLLHTEEQNNKPPLIKEHSSSKKIRRK